MGNAHWLILIPYYFFAAISVFSLLSLICRLVRAKAGANALAVAAVLLAIAAVALPLAGGWADLADFTGRRMLVLAAASFLLAALDAWLEPLLPAPLDKELARL